MINLQEIDTLVEFLPDTDSPVLDAGCAFGRDSAVLASKGLRTVGIDMSDELLTRAKSLHPDFEFAKMDVRELNFPDNSFSGIWCNAVLLHLKDVDVQTALAEFYRVLKPGGAVCISFKEGKGEQEVMEMFSSDQSRFYNFKTMDDTVALLEQQGFALRKQYILNERERFGEDKRDLNWVYCFATKSAAV